MAAAWGCSRTTSASGSRYGAQCCPVDEIFEVVVDSGFVGCRKPEREIYELTLERLGGVPAEQCLFIDDVDVNCEAARELGMPAVHYQHNEQAIPEIREALGL